MEIKEVKLAGRLLGEVKLPEEKDWKPIDRQPKPIDFESARVAMCAQATYEILERFPTDPDGPGDKPWIMAVVEAVSLTAKGRNDTYFEEDVVRRYMDHYGMGQVIRMFGGDPDRVREEIERMVKEGD